MANSRPQAQPTIGQDLEAFTVLLGAGSGPSNNVTSAEVGKFVSLAGSNRYNLAAVGAPIEGVIVAVENATQAGFSIGSIVKEGYVKVTFDGSEAAGSGAIAVGDFVVAGTPVAKGTALTSATPPKVRKATNQPGAVPADLTAAGQQARNAMYAWRVVDLGDAGTGAVGTIGVIERVTC